MGLKIKSPKDIGNAVRKRRKEDGLTLADASALCGVGYRFLSDLENGKPTCQLGKTLQVITGLGLELRIGPKEWQDNVQDAE
jgi:HTH-type transcriptional regulator / antitoxin HipB